ncbi:hypothetical protein [Mucilaginibacter terrae]|uniref:Carboxypeptidase regulatory-like domain-containing protein n=1 Tax=Mucilaginibacter terrae TaxID=1955052 RepID=A0ABU3GPR2_9SPHI|nr:hypothetical protein [Mucilaginibacter terrae]MDT3401775.1 hypothetical protein [Mucilaginibacter terrae]
MFKYGLKGALSFIHLAGCVFLFLFFTNKACAQIKVPLEDTIKLKFQRYQKANPSTVLFAHFDKTVYTNNENVWFTAYLLNAVNLNQHHTLLVSLVNDIDHSIVLEDKFVMTSGFGFGNMFLPDSIAPGNYTFMLYTNRVTGNRPQAMFTQPVTIKTTATTGFKVILSLTDTTSYSQGKNSSVMLTVNGDDYLPVAGADVNYTLAGTDTAIIAAKVKTDRAGQYIIPVPAGKSVVKVQVKNKKNSQYLYLALPQNNERARVKFYPEGGNMVNDIPVRVGWEVTNESGTPMRAKGLLYQNNKVIDTITTDSYGMGIFALTALPGNQYKVKLLGINQKNPEYDLPAALPNGLSLSIFKAVVNDTLHMQLRSSYSGTTYLHVHNYNQEFFCIPLDVEAFAPRRIKVDVTGLPKGVAEITLTDSLGRPFAERLFFARHNKRDKFVISTDKRIYNTREKATLKIRMSDDRPEAQGAVSVACVQDNRIELKKANDIESYFYLKNVLNTIPMREHYLTDNNGDKQFLESVLLIKGWRKYTWPELLSLNPANKPAPLTPVEFTGIIDKNGKPLKKPFSFAVARDSSLKIMETDATGKFTLSYEQMITTQDKLIKLITGKEYAANITNPYKQINTVVARNLVIPTYEHALSSLYTENFQIKGLEKAIRLAEVKVVANKNRVFLGMGANACGDYVCSFQILNCPNHAGSLYNTQPIVGQRYRFNGMKDYIYPGCLPDKEPISSIRGIYVAKQYYGSDYSVAHPSEPEYISTIFWRNLIKIQSGKDTQMTFYTSDITGRFRIIVQGITSNGVTYGESALTVKKP